MDLLFMQNLSADPNITKRVIKSVAPSVSCCIEIKTALALAMFGGREDKGNKRGSIHVFIISDSEREIDTEFIKYVQRSGTDEIYTRDGGIFNVNEFVKINPQESYDSSNTFIDNLEFTDSDPSLSKSEFVSQFDLLMHVQYPGATLNDNATIEANNIDEFNAKHIDSIIRIAEAHARMRLANIGHQVDMNTAIIFFFVSFITAQSYSVMEAFQEVFNELIGLPRWL